MNEQVEQFQRDGAVCLRQAFDRHWLSIVATGIEDNLEKPSAFGELLKDDGAEGGFFDDYCNWHRIPQFRAYVYESPAAQLAARLMNSSQAIFYHEHVLVKFPGTRKPTPWHHDQPYYPVDGQQCCSLWLPLESVERDSGMQFVRGSHAWGPRFVPRKFGDGRDYARGRDYQNEGESDPGSPTAFESVPDSVQLESEEILSWSMQPGDCIAFHMLTLHGAPGNLSEQTSRRALATRWLGDDASFAARPWQVSPPVTGGLSPGDPVACEAFPVVWPVPDSTGSGHAT